MKDGDLFIAQLKKEQAKALLLWAITWPKVTDADWLYWLEYIRCHNS